MWDSDHVVCHGKPRINGNDHGNDNGAIIVDIVAQRGQEARSKDTSGILYTGSKRIEALTACNRGLSTF